MVEKMKMSKSVIGIKNGIARFLFLFLVLLIILPSAVAAATGTLSITSSPSGATIQIDGVAVGAPTPQSFPDTWEGSHTVRLTKAGYDAYSTTVTVNPGKTTTVNGNLNPSTPGVNTPKPTPIFPALPLLALSIIGGIAILSIRKKNY